MALNDCIKRFERAGKPLKPEQIKALDAAIEEGLTDDQAVRRVSLMAHQNVIDIVQRARNEGATVTPVSNPVSELAKFQSRKMEELAKRKTEVTAETSKRLERWTAIREIEAVVGNIQRPGEANIPVDIINNTITYFDITDESQPVVRRALSEGNLNGFALRDTSAATVARSVARANEDFGILVVATASGALRGNESTGNDFGIVTEQGSSVALADNDAHDNRTVDLEVDVPTG